MSFLIEGRYIILIKYCILFLTTYYNQLVFIKCTVVAKIVFWFFGDKIVAKIVFWFFGDKIVFILLKYNHHCECFYCFFQVFGLDNCYLSEAY